MSAESPDFGATSRALTQDFASFISAAINAGYVGPQNAGRLLESWPRTKEVDVLPKTADVKGALDGIQQEPAVENEILAAALRKIDDFSPDEGVHVREEDDWSRWREGRIIDTGKSGVVVSVNKYVTITVPPYYPQLFRFWEGDIMEDGRRGTGHINPARYIIWLSMFDKRIDPAAYKPINNGARMFGAFRNQLRV